ncbi:MAG: Zn-dependent protease with chaperone function-like protein [Herbinix sp.]|jgi:Zn-dependent protease with chaperone function|nr:Zn-dependent protease with chaperone function-like protein [Herbinix sp.]
MKNKGNFFKYMMSALGLIWLAALITIMIAIVMGYHKDILFLLGCFGIGGFFLMMFIGFLGTMLMRKQNPREEELEHEVFLQYQVLAEISPHKLKSRIQYLSYSGNIYLMVLVVTILMTIVGVVVIGVRTGRSMGGAGTFIVGLIMVLFIIFQTINLKTEFPEEMEITKHDYPELINLVKSVELVTGADQVDHIFAVEEANAAVWFVPTGVWGRGKNYMELGIPLLQILNEDEVTSILIHELSHIYHKDTRLSSKMMYNFVRWSRILMHAETKTNVAYFILVPFAVSYIHEMDIFMNLIQKKKEYLADQEAIAFTNTETFARAIAKIKMMELYIKESTLIQKLRSKPQPPENFYSLLYEDFIMEYESKKENWLLQIKKRISSQYDTHPSFSERMKAIGVEDFCFHLSFDPKNSNYKAEIDQLVQRKEKEWYDQMRNHWEELNSEYQSQVNLIKTYQPTQDKEINIEYGMALEEVGEIEKAFAVYQGILSKAFDYAPAYVRIGQIKLNNYDESGIEDLIKAINLDSDFIKPTLPIIENYLMENGMLKEKEELDDWAREKIILADNIQDELDHVMVTDQFKECNQGSDIYKKISSIIQEANKIKRAYLVIKKLQYREGEYYVIGITHKSTVTKKQKEQSYHELSEQISALEIPYFLLDLNENPTFLKPLSSINHSEIK